MLPSLARLRLGGPTPSTGVQPAPLRMGYDSLRFDFSTVNLRQLAPQTLSHLFPGINRNVPTGTVHLIDGGSIFRFLTTDKPGLVEDSISELRDAMKDPAGHVIIVMTEDTKRFVHLRNGENFTIFMNWASKLASVGTTVDVVELVIQPCTNRDGSRALRDGQGCMNRTKLFGTSMCQMYYDSDRARGGWPGPTEWNHSWCEYDDVVATLFYKEIARVKDQRRDGEPVLIWSRDANVVKKEAAITRMHNALEQLGRSAKVYIYRLDPDDKVYGKTVLQQQADLAAVRARRLVEMRNERRAEERAEDWAAMRARRLVEMRYVGEDDDWQGDQDFEDLFGNWRIMNEERSS